MTANEAGGKQCSTGTECEQKRRAKAGVGGESGRASKVFEGFKQNALGIKQGKTATKSGALKKDVVSGAPCERMA